MNIVCDNEVVRRRGSAVTFYKLTTVRDEGGVRWLSTASRRSFRTASCDFCARAVTLIQLDLSRGSWLVGGDEIVAIDFSNSSSYRCQDKCRRTDDIILSYSA